MNGGNYTDKPDDTDSGTVQSVEHSFAIVRELQERGGATVTELADATGLSKSSVHKHLTTLIQNDFVVKREKTYQLGLRFLDVGAFARAQLRGSQLIQSKVRELAERTEETAQFATGEHGRAVVLYRGIGRRGVASRGRVGRRFFIHQSAAGKAILSQLPDNVVRRIVDRHGLPKATGRTISDEETLFDELDEIRDRGFAFNDEESTEGLRAVGVPLTGPDDDVLGAFAVAAPTHRMQGATYEEETPRILRSVVNELELNLAHS